jgi:adenylate cyclase
MDYTVIGDAVNVGSRLCSNAARGEVLVSRSVVERVGGRFRCEALPPTQLKGKSELMSIYRVCALVE